MMRTVPFEPIEMQELGAVDDLATRILAGEVFIMRGGLQKVGLFDELVEASLVGIRKSVGDETAERVSKAGFERIHEWVDAADVPKMTDAVYGEMAARVQTMMDKFVRQVFPGTLNYYYERSPNVRFHIPYALAASHRKSFGEFAGSHGDGKITAHGPHRDSWVDCPANVVNLWIAIGPVKRGNGLTIYARDYKSKLAFKNGYVADSQPLHEPMTFALEPGDAILFHSDQVHGSELNVTDSTRYVVSNRITLDKPKFLYGHHHHYVNANWARGPMGSLAEWPAKMQMSWFFDRFRRVGRKLGLWNASGSEQASSGNEAGGVPASEVSEAYSDDGSIALADLPVHSIRAVSKSVCVARFAENEFAALSRRCPHAGGDLAAGWVADGRPVCPLHNVSFDPKTGASHCSSLKELRTFSCEVRGDRLYLDTVKDAGNAGETELA